MGKAARAQSGATLGGLWAWFRTLHIGLQVLAWVVLFPLVAALAITRGQPEPRERLIVGVVVLVVGVPVWFTAFFGGSNSGDSEVAVPTPVEVTQDVAPESESEPTPRAAPEVATTPDPEPEPERTVDEVGDNPETGGVDAPARQAPTLEDPPAAPAQPDSSSNQARAPPEETVEGVLVSALLEQLTVAPEEPIGYDRDLFPHWITRNGCTTRNRVLIDESTITVTRNSNCTVTAGRWYSLFDDVWVDVPRSLDVDHMVPLAEAWRSGARNWTESTRRAFANDLDDPRSLIAVSASSNRSKSDSDPADWLPSYTAHRCDYVGAWVAIKHRWELSIDSREKAAIQRVLSGCGELRTSASEPARPATAPAPATTPAPAPTPAPLPNPAPAPEPAPVPADCININTASFEELQQIIHIGPARAADLISLRPFSSVDALTRISGIAAGRLADIKAQGLACVG